VDRNKRLGRGLDALFANEPSQTVPSAGTDAKTIHMLRPDQIVPSPLQPRQHFDAAALEGLADSIRKHGILEPIIVRPRDGSYEIVAGERRFQAATQAGLTELPVTVRELDDRTTMEIALSENLEREDLSPIEVAVSFNDYLTKFGTTQEELAQRLGKDRSTVATITAGHARALLPIKDEKQLGAVLTEVIRHQLSVRQTEALVRRLLTKKPKPTEAHDAALRNIQETMQKLLATRVNIRGRVNKGVIEISYFNQEDLLRILSILNSRDDAPNVDNSGD
jgi:ParB family chromosome partitioning protein